MQHPTCIAFHRANKLGDDVVALKAFYAAKILYPHTKILVFTNTFGATLYSCAPFVDEIINLDDDISFAQHTIDILIITHRTSHNIALAKRINAKKIIMQAHISNLLLPNFVKDFNFSIKSRLEGDNILRYVRKIDKKHFDTHISMIDFSQAKLQSTATSQEFVKNFLQTHAIDSTATLIGINIFGSGKSPYNFSLQTWLEVIQTLANTYPNLTFVLTSQSKSPICTMQFAQPNIAVFINDDIINLIALTSHLAMLVSCDTGNIHIADNLGIPRVGLYAKHVLKRWSAITFTNNDNAHKFASLCVQKNQNPDTLAPQFITLVREKLEQWLGICLDDKKI